MRLHHPRRRCRCPRACADGRLGPRVVRVDPRSGRRVGRQGRSMAEEHHPRARRVLRVWLHRLPDLSGEVGDMGQRSRQLRQPRPCDVRQRSRAPRRRAPRRGHRLRGPRWADLLLRRLLQCLGRRDPPVQGPQAPRLRLHAHWGGAVCRARRAHTRPPCRYLPELRRRLMGLSQRPTQRPLLQALVPGRPRAHSLHRLV